MEKKRRGDKLEEDLIRRCKELKMDNDKEIEAMKPRTYQNELLTKALAANSIVYLGTGSGKTYIAVMMIKEMQEDLKIGLKKSVFLVNSVPLVTQQKEYLARNLDLAVESFCGDDGVDFWDDKKWGDKIQNNQVLVMVHQVFLDALNHHFFTMSEVNLLIVDECHHTVGNSPYVQIFKGHYKPLMMSNPSAAPRVLGLSASIVTSKVNADKFIEEKMILEKILDATVITTENLGDLLKHVTQPEEVTVTYKSSVNSEDVNTVIETTIKKLDEILATEQSKMKHEKLESIHAKKCRKENEDKLKKFKRIFEQTGRCLEGIGLWCGNDVIGETKKLLEIETLTASTHFVEQLSHTSKEGIDKLKRILTKKLQGFDHLPMKQKLSRCSSDKATKVIEILRSSIFESSRAIVFVKERQTAPALAHLINLAEIPGVKAGFAVGSSFSHIRQPSSALFTKHGIERAKLDQTIRDFRQGKINVIVSTAVLEEGMDVQRCNLVFQFDPIQQFRSYVQSKGRARAKPSRFIVMVEETQEEVWKSDWTRYREIEEMSINKCHPMMDLDEDDDDDDDINLEPYFADPNNRNGPRITQYEAVSMIHRYVQSLPSDRFTTLSSYWEFKQDTNSNRSKLFAGLGIVEQQFKCVLHLPHLSPYRDPIVGPFQSTKKAAKCAVALKACGLLHKDGILDDHLWLTKKSLLDELNAEDLLADPRKPKSGTRRSRSYYPNKLPTVLASAKPNLGTCYIYRINMKLTEESSFARQKKHYRIYHPEQVNRKLAIVVGQKLSEAALQSFDLFTISGKVQVQLELVNQIVKFPEEFLQKIFKFQTEVIPSVLGSEVSWTEFNSDSSDYLVIPVDKDGKPDRELLDTVLRPPTWPMTAPGKKFTFKTSMFDDAVIHPKHKETTERFFVEEIVRQMSPKSLLPNDKSRTFKSYYNIKHRQSITQDDQPLLRISNANKHHFMFAPISSYPEELLQKSRDDFLQEKTLYIPELVQVESVPASLWREIQMLPFIVHRIASFIRIGEFRQRISDETSLGIIKNNNRFVEFDNAKFFDHLIHQRTSLGSGLPSIQDFKEALTLTGAGESFDLERWEILGDAFLKFSVSLSLYLNKSISKKHEGFLTQFRSRLVGNRNLLNLTRGKNLSDLLSVRMFEPHLDWLAPRLMQRQDIESTICQWDEEFRESFYSGEENGEQKEKLPNVTLFDLISRSDVEEILVAGPNSKSKKKQILGKARQRLNDQALPKKDERIRPRENVFISDKSLADSAEALIGVFLGRLGQGAALDFMSWLGLELSPDVDIDDLIRGNKSERSSSVDWFLTQSSFPKNAFHNQDEPSVEGKMSILAGKLDMKAIEEIIGYSFVERSFLIQAFTHSSYMPNKLTDSYERLEFLGDAVIDYLVTCHLFTLDKNNFSPGQITDLRSALVNNNTLASIAADQGFNKHLLYLSPPLMTMINKYLDMYEADRTEDTVQARTPEDKTRQLMENLGLINEEECPILESIDVPKVLGDIVEALLGAIYLDSKGDLGTCWKVFARIFPGMSDVIRKKPKNPVAQLYEKSPKPVTFDKPVVTNSRIVSMVVIVGPQKMKFRGIGSNKQTAKLAAAKCALRELKKRDKI